MSVFKEREKEKGRISGEKMVKSEEEELFV